MQPRHTHPTGQMLPASLPPMPRSTIADLVETHLTPLIGPQQRHRRKLRGHLGNAASAAIHDLLADSAVIE